MCRQDSHLLCFGQCYGLDVTGWELDVLTETSTHQWPHSAKDPDIALYEMGERQISLISLSKLSTD